MQKKHTVRIPWIGSKFHVTTSGYTQILSSRHMSQSNLMIPLNDVTWIKQETDNRLFAIRGFLIEHIQGVVDICQHIWQINWRLIIIFDWILVHKFYKVLVIHFSVIR